MKNQNLILELKKQHRLFMNDLLKIRELINSDKINFEKIIKNLNIFKKDFLDHLELENKTFYPQFLKLKSKEKIGIKDTQKFIDKMQAIEDNIFKFLDFYHDDTLIKNNIVKFKDDLNKIIDILSLRVEAEEGFIFVDWEMLAKGLYGS